MERGRSKDPGKQERLDNYKAQFKNGKKRWVRYDEGAILYSMGIHSFMDLANEAKFSRCFTSTCVRMKSARHFRSLH